MVPAAASVEITDTATTNFPLLGEFLNIASECTVRSNTFTGNMVPGLQYFSSAELPNLANGTYTPSVPPDPHRFCCGKRRVLIFPPEMA